jgi:hypothetical protein
VFHFLIVSDFAHPVEGAPVQHCLVALHRQLEGTRPDAVYRIFDQNQTTNFRTLGGSFAAVFTAGDD